MDTMTIPAAQIAMKKKIGQADGKDLTYMKLVGGLHLITNHHGHVVGSGPHKAVARRIASQRLDDVTWTELSKSDHLPYEAYAHLMAEAEETTNALRKAQGLD